MKYTEQCHYKKTEKLKKEEHKFDINLTLLILLITAYSYISLAYKLPLWVNVIAAFSGTLAFILSLKREKFHYSEYIKKHRNTADAIFKLTTQLRIIRLKIINDKISFDEALKDFNDISDKYDAICQSALDIDSKTYDEVQKTFLQIQEVTPEEIKVVFPEYQD